jgi:hypothetical protein
MLFKINQESKALEPIRSDWCPHELELERYLIASTDDGVQMLSESVFGEPLLLVRNQVRTHTKKRADILALDRSGNGVIVELKRHEGRLGVETQALQYLADFSTSCGRNFIRRFSGERGISEDIVLGFMGGDAEIENINRRSRVILLARSFDETVFSIGEWLSSKGVAFRCIEYLPVEVSGTKLLSFSIAFDRSPEGLYPVKFASATREPGIFWHNIAKADEGWWQFLVNSGQIPASFENTPGDQGERILRRYIAGDIVVAYVTGFGAIGWGIVEDPNSYHLLRLRDKGDYLHGDCRHRLAVNWKAAAGHLKDALSADEVRRDFGIYHPISTSVLMKYADGKRLIDRLSERFGVQQRG